MPRMIKELEKLPPEETGFLGHNGIGFTTIQYWRGFDHLEAYARSQENKHFPAWTAFNKRMKNARGGVGIWHETYLVKAGHYEAIYSGMPEYELGRVSTLVPAQAVATKHDSAWRANSRAPQWLELGDQVGLVVFRNWWKRATPPSTATPRHGLWLFIGEG
jgi:hypothetical protein